MTKLSEKYIYPFFETIRIQDGRIQLLDYHQRRMNRVFRYFYPGHRPHAIADLVELDKYQGASVVKCRLDYSHHTFSCEYSTYHLRSILKLVPIESTISYPFKYADRTELDAISTKVHKSEEPLLIAHGRLKETTFGNVIFRIDNRWVTPMYPMFYGIMREFLVSSGQIEMADLFLEDLDRCDQIKIVNAMMPPEACILVCI